jgi:hypothetical protein
VVKLQLRIVAAQTHSHAVHALRIIDAIRVEVGRYYGTLALINLGFGAVTAIAGCGFSACRIRCCGVRLPAC